MTPEKPRHEGEWVSVPREPSTMMLLNGCVAYDVEGELAHHDGMRRAYKAMLAASPAPAALGTPEGNFSVVSWRRKGDELWLYHKASGNKKANLYELALVGEIESLRAERSPASPAPAALGTPEGEERICEELREDARSRTDDYFSGPQSAYDECVRSTPSWRAADLIASQARTIAALKADTIEECAKVAESYAKAHGPRDESWMIVHAIRALSPTPNQEKKE